MFGDLTEEEMVGDMLWGLTMGQFLPQEAVTGSCCWLSRRAAGVDDKGPY